MLTPGTLIGRDFRVLRLLREGGMGAVYVAEQMSLGETRALKVMRGGISGLEDPERLRKYRERFLEEARRSSGLHSAHVVKVVASGVDEESGTPWLAMELLHGEDLDGVLQRRGRLPWVETLQLFEQLGHGLIAAHAAGVLHLDLKPENVFIAHAESPGVPFTAKILDFGIGRVLEEHRTSVTATTAVGSPLWMSPEQALKQRVSAATDIWALGLIAYRCLTGRHYWREANKSAEEFAPTSWILELMTQPLEPASVRAREQGVEEFLPAGFDAWFARCVTRELEARWQKVDAMLDAFRCLGGTSAVAPGPSPLAPTAPMPTMALTAPPALAAAGVPPTVALSTEVPGAAAREAHNASTRPARNRAAITLACVALSLMVLGTVWAVRPRTPQVMAPASQSASPPRPAATVGGAVHPHDAAVDVASRMLSCPEGFALVPGGVVTPRSYEHLDSSAPTEVASFCMQIDETTAGGYQACIDAPSGRVCPPQPRDRRCNLSRRVRGDHPADCIPWQNAAAWCAWAIAGGRLPSNAEWSLAAHRDGRRYPWGNELPVGQVCWTEGYPIGQQRLETCRLTDPGADLSQDGLHGLGGSVQEWTADVCQHATGAGHIVRGRAWVSRSTDPEVDCWTDSGPSALGPLYVGFRCAVAPSERDAAQHASP